jgi:hypothetical protein
MSGKTKSSKRVEQVKKNEQEARREVIKEERQSNEDIEEEDQYQEDWNSDSSD